MSLLKKRIEQLNIQIRSQDGTCYSLVRKDHIKYLYLNIKYIKMINDHASHGNIISHIFAHEFPLISELDQN